MCVLVLYILYNSNSLNCHKLVLRILWSVAALVTSVEKMELGVEYDQPCTSSMVLYVRVCVREREVVNDKICAQRRQGGFSSSHLS